MVNKQQRLYYIDSKESCLFDWKLMLKKLVKQCDMFAAPPLLRVKGQPESTNVCGGVCSILIVILFVVIFGVATANLFKLKEIESVETVTDISDPRSVKGLVFSVGVLNTNISNLNNIFTVQGSSVVRGEDGVLVTSPIPAEPCRPSLWEQANNYEYFFDMYELDRHMCLNASDVQIYGLPFQDNAQAISIKLSKCSNSTSQVACADSATIDAFFDAMFATRSHIIGQIYTLSTSINVHNAVAAEKIIYTQAINLPFSNSQKSEVLMKIGTFQVTTDSSFMPWVYETKENGSFVEGTSITSIFEPDGVTDLILCRVVTCPTHREVHREYGKIDDTLSYIGGLFGILISFFAFFMRSFNEYRYELAVTEGSINQKFEDGKNVSEDHMTFKKYIKYTAYDWIKSISGHEMEWQDCRKLQRAREEGASLIDVGFLLKRVNDLEEINKVRMTENQDLIFSLCENVPMSKMKKKRLILEYQKLILKGRVALSINTISVVSDIVLAGFNKSNEHSLQSFSGSNAKIFFEQKSSSNNLFNQNHEEEKNKQEELMWYESEKQQSSFRMVKRYLQKYEDYLKQFEEQIPQLEEEYIQVEEQLAKNLKNITEESRKSLLPKIPLPILRRLFSYYKAEDEKQFNLQNNSNNFIKVRPLKKMI